MINTHTITLPETQARWWHEICIELGIRSIYRNGVVLTTCSNSDRIAAWELFREQYKLKIEEHPIIQ